MLVSAASESAKAYPLRILHYHEIVNDRVDGRPIAVTWCPLCGSAAVYDRRVDDRTLSFGVSGKLADDDLVMYDRETESEWKQSTGRAIAGSLAGRALELLPARLIPLRAFREAYPDGVVLQPPGGRSEAVSGNDEPAAIHYDPAPYDSYFEDSGIGLGAHRGTGGREWAIEQIDPKEPVLGLTSGDDAVGVRHSTLTDAGGAIRVSVAEHDVLVVSTEGGPVAYEHPGFPLERAEDALLRGDGARWNPITGASDDSRRLSPFPARRLFAFTWVDDYGPDAFWRG